MGPGDEVITVTARGMRKGADRILREEAKRIHAGAVKVLGPDLRGYSVLDLLADNMPYPLDVLRPIAEEIKAKVSK